MLPGTYLFPLFLEEGVRGCSFNLLSFQYWEDQDEGQPLALRAVLTIQ
jgi:hypothetical protein